MLQAIRQGHVLGQCGNKVGATECIVGERLNAKMACIGTAVLAVANATNGSLSVADLAANGPTFAPKKIAHSMTS
jgi:hypothetical protein